MNINKIFESKTFLDSVKYIIFGIWLVSGVAGFYMIPGTNLSSQWAYGALFGMGLFQGCTFIVTKLFWVLYNNISAFRSYVDKHYGDQ